MEKSEILYGICSLCGNESGYDKDSLKASTYYINGNEHILCIPCEDSIKKILNKQQVKQLKEFIKNNKLMNKEKLTLQTIKNELQAKYD